MTCIINDPVGRAQFNAQGIASMGIDPAWDTAVAAYIIADVRARAQESYGPLAATMNEADGHQMSIERRLGPAWLSSDEGRGAAQEFRKAAAAYEAGMHDVFYQPFWEAMRGVARTPAPSLAAVAWKAAMIDLQEVWNDALFEGDCVALLDADLERLSAVTAASVPR